MYRVFLADDEPWILEGLRACIDWETLGFTLCGTAENGLDALEKIGRLRPDCLLADIRMPGMDGLTLIARAREENPRLRCAILSGYAEFTYAREGIRQGVDGYLLKPIEETDLEALLRIMRSKLDMPLLLPTVADTPDPLEAVRQYVDAHALEVITLPELAEKFGFNASYLSQQFQRHTGETLVRYITLRRVAHACRLLRETDRSISEIAQRSGFTDPLYFRKVFRKVLAQTPSAYRAREHE